jgi:putative ABC transport system permease protein
MGWLRRLFHKRLTEKRMDAELRFHLEQRVRDYVASGLSPEEARRQAQLAFGGLEQIKQDCREARTENHVEDFLRDFQYALRSLAKDRRFALIAIFALALGIGATTVMFSVIYNVVFDPFPYRDFQHSVTFEMRDLARTGNDAVTRYHYTIPEFLAIREQNHVFEDIIGNYQLDVLYSDGGGTRRLRGGYVTTNGFDFLGVPPLLGRTFTTDDTKPGAPFVFVMNYHLWQTQFGGDSKILGTTFFLNGKPRTLVGIMPQRFNGYDASVWLPLNLSPGGDGSSFPVKDATVIWALARLKKGVGLQVAAADLDAIMHRMAEANPGELYPQRFTLVTRTLVDFVVGDFRNTLYALLAAVFMLLLISCGNVGNLLLARASAREKEIAVRASLGASRGRLIRQLLVESFVLAAAACVAGCLFAYFGLKGLVHIIPRGPIPEETVIGLNWVVLLFALAIAVLVTLICGLVPALHAVRGNLLPAMAGSGKGSGGSVRHGRLRSGLVIGEVALSIVLLTGAGLMMRSFFTLTHVDLGFDPAHMLYARVVPTVDAMNASGESADIVAKRTLFFQQVLRRVQVLPGVHTATISLGLPPLGGASSEITVLGKPPSQHWEPMVDLCGEAYFQTLGLRLLRGRLLSEADIDSARHVVVVNQAFARAYFTGENPLGQKVKFNVFDQLPDTPRDAYFEVIGVITDFKNRGLLEPPLPEVFLPYSITGYGERNILASTAVDPKTLLASVQREIWAVDSNAAVTGSGSIKDLLAEEAYVRPQFGLISIGVFAGIGLALVLIGIFSVMAYTVALQTHEIGVRIALGAQRGNVLTMVLWKGLRLISIGMLIGVLASLGLTRFLASQISGVSASDPFTFFAVVILFLTVGLIASLLPARRAADIDPLAALRYE